MGPWLVHFVSSHATPLAAVAAAASAIVAAIGLMLSARATTRQTNSQILIEYTRRYMEVLTVCPDQWYRRLEDPPPEPDPKMTRALHLYLDIENQQLYLKNKGLFSEEIWRLWEVLLIKTLQSPFFHREWPTLRQEFSYDPGFIDYVESHAGLRERARAQ